MTFDQVIVFHEIVRMGSFKAAAAQLHKTQPAISFAIKKLEEEMDALLFDRSGYRPVLTAHGKAFLDKSYSILKGMNELKGLSESFKNREEPELAISVDGISPLPKLLNLFKNFSARYPNTKLNLEFGVLSESERKVLSREAQFGITHFISDTSVLEIVPITHVRMVPVMNKDLYLERKVGSQADLVEIDQIIVSDKNKNSPVSFGIMAGGRKWRLNDSNFKREIILAGLGWGHLAEHSIERELADHKLVVLNFEDVHPRNLDINVIRLKKAPMGVVARTLWEELTSWHG